MGEKRNICCKEFSKRKTILYIPHIWYESKALGSFVICWLMCYTKSIDQFHYSCIQQDMTYCIRVPNTEMDITSIFLIKIKKNDFSKYSGKLQTMHKWECNSNCLVNTSNKYIGKCPTQLVYSHLSQRVKNYGAPKLYFKQKAAPSQETSY